MKRAADRLHANYPTLNRASFLPGELILIGRYHDGAVELASDAAPSQLAAWLDLGAAV